MEDIFDGDYKQLLNFINDFKYSGSNREDLINIFKLHLYQDFMKKNGFKRILLGNSGQRLASKIFGNFSKGKAINVDHDVSCYDEI